MLESYADVFFTVGPLRQTAYVVYDIEVLDNKPFRLAPYRHSAKKKKAIQEQVKRMLADGMIKPSLSPYSSPIVMARKKDGRFRFSLDYSRLKAITKDTSQNFSIIQKVIKAIGDAKIFTTLGLKDRYWQIPLTERSKPYT